MQEILSVYLEKYLPRKDILHRLPVSVPIAEAWPQLQKARRERSKPLPLAAVDGQPFWWVLTESITKQTEEILSLARRELVFEGAGYEEAFREALPDEAYYSGVIEGAFTTKREAREVLSAQRSPKNRSEQMVKNNYEALGYVLEHLDTPITEQTILDIWGLVTKDTLDADEAQNAYRSGKVFVRSGRGELVYTAPEAEKVPGMMASLVDFLANDQLSPLIKACVAHFYFVYVHPFSDGNGRTARTLSYMLLLQAGYDFFRFFSISDVIARERSKYYKAIKDVEDDDFDMTYFIDYYTGMLARAVRSMEERLINKVVLEQTLEKLKRDGMNERVMEGAKWILTSPNHSVTIREWQKKFGVVTETARQDLLKLEAEGVVGRKLVRRQYVFEIVK